MLRVTQGGRWWNNVARFLQSSTLSQEGHTFCQLERNFLPNLQHGSDCLNPADPCIFISVSREARVSNSSGTHLENSLSSNFCHLERTSTHVSIHDFQCQTFCASSCTGSRQMRAKHAACHRHQNTYIQYVFSFPRIVSTAAFCKVTKHEGLLSTVDRFVYFIHGHFPK